MNEDAKERKEEAEQKMIEAAVAGDEQALEEAKAEAEAVVVEVEAEFAEKYPDKFAELQEAIAARAARLRP